MSAKKSLFVYVYWDNSNIFVGAQRKAQELEGGDAQYRVRIHFANLLALAHNNRPVQRAVAAGSVPPELERLWRSMRETCSKGMAKGSSSTPTSLYN